MLWLEITAPIVGYVVTSGYAYRRRYVLHYKAWRRWQADGPDKHAKWGDYPDVRSVLRKDVSYWTYVWNLQSRTPAPIMGMLWPFYGVTKGAKKLLQPEVKVPDYEKIKELEKD